MRIRSFLSIIAFLAAFTFFVCCGGGDNDPNGNPEEGEAEGEGESEAPGAKTCQEICNALCTCKDRPSECSQDGLDECMDTCLHVTLLTDRGKVNDGCYNLCVDVVVSCRNAGIPTPWGEVEDYRETCREPDICGSHY